MNQANCHIEIYRNGHWQTATIFEPFPQTLDKTALSPLFDFAPMFLDPEGINRVCRWEDELPGNQPDWGAVCEKLSYVVDPTEARKWLVTLSGKVRHLPDVMRECHVDDDIIERLARWIEDVAAGLAAS